MSPEPVVLLSALEHYMYCPRQCALIHVDGLWAENKATVAGTRSHRRVDTSGARLERGRTIVRAVPLHSDRYGLSGRADAIELHYDGRIAPIEHKAGVRHARAADVQLCAQALCLEEMFARDIPYGFVWFGGTRRRERIELDEDLRTLTLAVIDQIRCLLVAGTLPAPVADGRCRACQLEPICMPRVVLGSARIERYLDDEVFSCH